MKTVRDAEVTGKKILLRVDYNVPLDQSGAIADDNRIVETIPTIEWLLRHNVEQIIILTHFARPQGKVNEAMRLSPVVARLSEVLKRKKLISGGRVISKSFEEKSPVLNRRYYVGRSITVLENLRFDSGEEENSVSFAKKLARCGDIYVNDAFATSHRSHASLVAITKLLPSFAGLLLADELRHLTPVLKEQEKPFVAVIGGAKIKDKIPIINLLRKKADTVILGGKTANDYYAVLTEPVEKVVFPTDGVDERGRIVKFTQDIVKKTPPMDIGPDTIVRYKTILKQAKTVFWNGTLGVAENKKFCHGSYEIARFIANLRATTIASGGDTARILDKLNIKERYSFVSTGGGAASEFLIGRSLPGLIALEENAGIKPENVARSTCQ